MSVQYSHILFAFKGQAAAQQLVGHHTQAVDVGSVVYSLVGPGLFGSHIVGSAHHRPACLPSPIGSEASDAKIG